MHFGKARRAFVEHANPFVVGLLFPRPFIIFGQG